MCHSCSLISVTAVSSVKEIKPVDWERPRRIGFVFESRNGIMETSVEFDTIEAARDWRNEVNGALLAIRFSFHRFDW